MAVWQSAARLCLPCCGLALPISDMIDPFFDQLYKMCLLAVTSHRQNKFG